MSHAATIVVTSRQRELLEKWVRMPSKTPYRLVQRSRIILLSSEGVSNVEQGRRLGVDRQRVRRWRSRWSANTSHLLEAEEQGASEGDLSSLMQQVLCDAPRCGAPSRFSAEQLTQVLGLACEPPEESGRPVTHWTPRELAQEAMQRGIVEEISPRHVSRLLKKGLCVRTKAVIG